MAQFDIYETVTARIIEQLEKGVIPWEKPWSGVQGGAISGSTGKPYSLINQMLLGKPGKYFTFKQVTERGGQVRKGEKSSVVVFWKQVPIKETDSDGNPVEKLVPMLRYFNVFHIDQCSNITARHIPVEQPPVASAEEVISRYSEQQRLTIEHRKCDEAFYSPARDRVVVPLREQFQSVAEYYGTLFHELTHSTGHKNRLNRIKATAHFGDNEYSQEELVAEIGSAALLNQSGIETARSLRNSAAYIQSWLKALKNDKRMIVHASGQAAKAVNFILGEHE